MSGSASFQRVAEIANTYFPQGAKAARLRAITSIGGSKTPASRSWAQFIEELFQGFDLIGDGESRRTQ
jgi:hypothetical protein